MRHTALALTFSVIPLLSGCPKDEDKAAPAPSNPVPSALPAHTPAPAPAAAPAATPASVPTSGDLYATFQTSVGDIVVRLFPKDAPKTVENFVQLAKGQKEWTDPRNGQKTSAPLYDGTVFHRVIPEFMIQGGDPLGTGTGGPGYRFPDEFQGGHQFDKPGLLAMANSGPNTNGSQFFITEKPTPWLNGKHTIFGEVISGYELVPKIARMRNSEVTLKHVEISEKPPK
jgi:peptidyl-prolyl cis-trans isomerase A (cyclophilin A)